MRRRLLGIAAAILFPAVAAAQYPTWTQWPSTWIQWNGGITASFYSVLQNNGVSVPQEQILNFIPGTNVTFSFADNPGTGTTSLTINAPAAGGGLGDPGSNGMLSRTALNVTAARTFVCTAAYCSWTNGDGVAGAPTLTLALTQANDAGAIVSQATTPGTQQGSGGNHNWNVNGAGILELDGLTNTVVPGLTLQNGTAATAGTTLQYSPAQLMCGSSWNTTSLLPETDCWHISPQLASGNPTSTSLIFERSINGGAYSSRLTIADNGTATVAGALNVSAGNISASQANSLIQLSGSNNSGAGGFSYTMQNGGLGLLTGLRSVTPACSSGTTCTGGTNIPANAIILGIAYRITTAITGATTIELGTAATPAGFCTGITTLTLGSTGVCSGNSVLNASAGGPVATATAGTYTAGVIEFEVYYLVITPPTS